MTATTTVDATSPSPTAVGVRVNAGMTAARIASTAKSTPTSSARPVGPNPHRHIFSAPSGKREVRRA